MKDNEYRIDVKVKNNLILKKIEKSGYKTVGEFARKNNIHASAIGSIVNMTESPLLKDGKFRDVIYKISDLLNCCPEDFFTESQLYAILKTNKRTLEVNESEMKFMLEYKEDNKSLEEIVMEDYKNNIIKENLSLLTQREEKVLRLRFGFDEREHTLEEVSKIIGITRERVRQTEAKALRKLRHPSMTEELRELY